jgi:hypothetical protein
MTFDTVNSTAANETPQTTTAGQYVECLAPARHHDDEIQPG